MRILGAFYLRLTGTDSDIYLYLEPLYNDYRKLRMKKPDGRKLYAVHMHIRFLLTLSVWVLANLFVWQQSSC